MRDVRLERGEGDRGEASFAPDGNNQNLSRLYKRRKVFLDMETVVAIVVFAVCAMFVETNIKTYDENEIKTVVVSDEEFAKSVEIEKEWRK
jgi:peroxiredoxin